jgi:hypothetical protein
VSLRRNQLILVNKVEDEKTIGKSKRKKYSDDFKFPLNRKTTKFSDSKTCFSKSNSIRFDCAGKRKFTAPVFVESAPLQQSRVRNNPSEARNRVTG